MKRARESLSPSVTDRFRPGLPTAQSPFSSENYSIPTPLKGFPTTTILLSPATSIAQRAPLLSPFFFFFFFFKNLENSNKLGGSRIVPFKGLDAR